MKKIKDILGVTGVYFVIIVWAIGYIYNIVYLIDNWGSISLGYKIVNLFSMILFPPFGSLFGVYNFIF